MNKVLFTFFILVTSITGYVWASTVSTTDGQNFTVTNDLGVSANYSMSLINSYAVSAAQQSARDQQTLVADSEVAYSWGAVQAMAVNAYNNYETQNNAS